MLAFDHAFCQSATSSAASRLSKVPRAPRSSSMARSHSISAQKKGGGTPNVVYPKLADRPAIAERLRGELHRKLREEDGILRTLDNCIDIMLKNRLGSNGHQFSAMRTALTGRSGLVDLITRYQEKWDRAAAGIDTRVRSVCTDRQWKRVKQLVADYKSLKLANQFFTEIGLPSKDYLSWIKQVNALEAAVGVQLANLRDKCPLPTGPAVSAEPGLEVQNAFAQYLSYLHWKKELSFEEFSANFEALNNGSLNLTDFRNKHAPVLQESKPAF